MAEPIKRVDESWKEQAEREKRGAASTAGPQGSQAPPQAQGPTQAAEGQEELPQARFDLFISGLAMEAFIAMGDVPNPATRKRAVNLPQVRYLIDLLALLEEKTQRNLTADEEKLLKDALYQLRMRYLAKSGGS